MDRKDFQKIWKKQNRNLAIRFIIYLIIAVALYLNYTQIQQFIIPFLLVFFSLLVFCIVVIAGIRLVIRLFQIMEYHYKIKHNKPIFKCRDFCYLIYHLKYSKYKQIPKYLNGNLALLNQDKSHGFIVRCHKIYRAIRKKISKYQGTADTPHELYSYCHIMYCYDSNDKLLRNMEWKSDQNHNAIVISPSRGFKAEYFAFGPELLTDYFIEHHIPYKIYQPQSISDFDEIIKNNNAQVLWLFGHGSIGSYVVTNGDVVEYRRYRENKWQIYKKIAIHQLHCNCRNPESSNPLSKILVDGWDYREKGMHNFLSNKAYVEYILSNTKKIPGIWHSTEY